MKNTMFGMFLAAMLGAAQAGTLEVGNASGISFTNYDGQPLTVTGPESSGLWGYLYTTSAGIFSATYLGNESGYTNSFVFGFPDGSLYESNALGTTISKTVGSGIAGFSFSDDAGGGHTFSNGQQQTYPLGFAILNGQTNQYGTFDYLLGFNDSYTGDADYDDFVVGVNFISSPVPEPQTYAMLLSGLGLLGFAARRRKNNV